MRLTPKLETVEDFFGWLFVALGGLAFTIVVAAAASIRKRWTR